MFAEFFMSITALFSYSCSCPEGMELDEDRTCRDVNECERDSPCEHICENTEGRSALRFCRYTSRISNFLSSLTASSASALMALSSRRKEENVLMSTNVDWEFTSAVTNVSTRKEVTVVHALKTYSSQAMANDVSTRTFVHTITADVVRYVNSIIIIRFAHVEEDLKSIKKIKLSATILTNATLSISEYKKIFENIIQRIHFVISVGCVGNIYQQILITFHPFSCQQQCVNTIGSYRCDCFSGFRMNENGQCIDINECDVENNANIRCPKTANCINTAGSYKCICPDGHKLSRDRTECIEIKNECKPLIVKNGNARCTRSR